MADKKGSRGGPEEVAENEVNTQTVSSSNGEESSSRSAEKRSADTSSEESSTQPCPPKVSKVGFALGGQIGKKSSSISIKLGAPSSSRPAHERWAPPPTGNTSPITLLKEKPKDVTPPVVPKKNTVAAVFNDEDDSEPEEMPPEAKMRMKNIGRDTPTSSGPNSFNKGKHGFTDTQKLWERNIKPKPDHVEG